MYCAQRLCHSDGRGKGICVTHIFWCHSMWKRSSVSCHQTHLSEREREVQHLRCDFKAAWGREKRVWFNTQVPSWEIAGEDKREPADLGHKFHSYTLAHTHSYSHEGWATVLQQHPSGFCYILWLLICVTHIWYKLLFSVICCKQTLVFKVKFFSPIYGFPKTSIHLALLFWPIAQAEFKFVINAGHPCKQNVSVNIYTSDS